MPSTLEIQQLNEGTWKNIGVSQITTSDDEIIVLGNSFRILVNGNEVYRQGVS